MTLTKIYGTTVPNLNFLLCTLICFLVDRLYSRDKSCEEDINQIIKKDNITLENEERDY